MAETSLTLGVSKNLKKNPQISDYLGSLEKERKKLLYRKILIRYRREILQDMFEFLKVLALPSHLVKEVTSYFPSRGVLILIRQMKS